ncbi:MAG: hypothetical protein C0508_21350 [Cyanobacteria bacterium PR.023]|jgi:hypothetical protein|nr:hypothetical protein [Cyanobacteria bacterium PR.023]
MAKINPWKVTGYKAGQNVVCTVKGADQGGYEVVIKKDNLPGFIKTTATLKIGDEILAQFVCVHKDRVLLTPIFQGNRGVPGASVAGGVNWQEHSLENLDEAYEQKSHEQRTYRGLDDTAEAQAQQQATKAYQTGNITQTGSNPYQTGSNAPILPQQSGQSYAPEQYASPEQQWEAPNQHTPQKRFRLRRAIDLLMPPPDQESLESLKTFKISDYDLEWLITDVEGGMRTGCLKATCESKMSRAAILLYRGRAVGCIYGCKSNPDAKATEESLSLTLTDLEAPDTLVTMYDLPDEAALAMSALFLGLALEREDNLDSRSYFDHVMNWFVTSASTACVVITLPSSKSTYLVFVGKGQFGGAFFVEEQQFTKDRNAIYQLFEADQGAVVEVSLLSPEAIAPGVRFGYSLTMARQKRPSF